jgi:hypothetical protein
MMSINEPFIVGTFTGLRLRSCKNFNRKQKPGNVAYFLLAYESARGTVVFMCTTKRAQPVKVTMRGNLVEAEIVQYRDLELAADFADAMGYEFISDPVRRALVFEPYSEAISDVVGTSAFDYGWLRFANLPPDQPLDGLEEGERRRVGIFTKGEVFRIFNYTSKGPQPSR